MTRYSFGNTRSGTDQFLFSKINGNASADRSTFLNSSKVTVGYRRPQR